MKKVFLIILVLCSTFSVVAQQYDTAVSPLKGEKWWGGIIADLAAFCSDLVTPCFVDSF